jgi:hypothetical protein
VDTGRALSNGAMLIDRYLPTFDASLTTSRVIDARPEETFAAVKRLDFSRSYLVRALVWVRNLPERLRSLRNREKREPRSPTKVTFEDVTKGGGWVLLGEQPGEEMVLGLVGKFWKRNFGIMKVDAAEFAAFDKPGYAKTVLGISIRPYGEGRSLITYENRTATTSEDARKSFRRYWRLIGAGAAIVGHRTLALVKNEAEHPSVSKAA